MRMQIPPQIITDTEKLRIWCDKARNSKILCVDTEFIRERTYFPGLSLIQLGTREDAVIVDPLAEDIDLEPVFELMRDEGIIKIFHACRQDMEIFFQRMNSVPAPVFDTQVAAMVCGFGEACSYSRLVHDICGHELEKGSQFTDWNKRPLQPRQIEYAIADVTFLPAIYDHLQTRLKELGREGWIAEEMEELHDRSLYESDPTKAWEKIKLRSRKPRYVAVVQKLAAWREEEAQRRNHPRQWVIKDDAISEVAAMQPRDIDELRSLRGTRSNMSDNTSGKIIAMLQEVYDMPESDLPRLPPVNMRPYVSPAAADLLRILLKDCSDSAEVASRLIASSDDLDDLAAGKRTNIHCLHGWRFDIFGQYALKLLNGEIALSAGKKHLKIIELEKQL